MQKPYQALIPDHIYFGGADDIQQMADEEQIEVVVDLRAESTGCAASNDHLVWQQIPLGDGASALQSELFQEAIQTVVAAYRDGKKVAFHCGGGKGRTGTVAVGVLLELGVCQQLDEAELMAKSIRPLISLKPDQRKALEQLYPTSK
ncbi:dual specificity protein phosphatase family protein [Leeia sp. TBRC 13508]|uniref:Dual specificity protein phosphatase family protein n=1 Tax=Leeia speluncae TaxID=2884804 RepID=A0ABS8D7N9_9NEIS|nr:dual specificity protein phosphatase family protein [Leeia speluncae]MCB6184220.1 dual specificity protein phosphatase family protein [Leeia speluncae]